LILLRLTGVLTAASLVAALSFSEAAAQVTKTSWQALSDKIIVQASPSPSPAAAPPAEHKYRIKLSGDTNLSIIDQNYIGSGLGQNENSAFISGLPFGPGMPYDFFSNAPTSSGFGLGQNVKLNLVYGPAAVEYGVTLGFGSVSGSANTVGYWGEQPIPTINPHLGQTSYQLPITCLPAPTPGCNFPTRPGLDDVSGVRGSVLGGFVQTKDQNMSLHVGWLDLQQTQKFVFQQAPVTNSSPSLAVVPPNSIGAGAPTLDDWLPSNLQLPLSGADAFAKVGDVSFEGTIGSLPAPMGVGARVNTASVFYSPTNGAKFGAQYSNIRTGGMPISSTTFFGAPIVNGVGAAGSPCTVPTGFSPAGSPVLQPFPGIITTTSGTISNASNFGQGPIPFTCLNGQQNQIWGFSGSGNLFTFVDGIAEVGLSQYSTTVGALGVGTGAYLHGGLTEHIGPLSLTQDYYSVDPRYAPTILPYGACCNPPNTTENIWSSAYSWPAQWLRGTYQSVDNTQAYNDRRGFKFGADYESDLIQARVKYSVLSQIYPITLATGSQAGFVEGYYLPELVNTGGNLGIDRQLAIWVGLHPKIMDVSLDYVTQNNYRPGNISPGALGSLDTVAMNYPQMSVTLSRHLSEKFLLAGGFSDFLVKGTWAGSAVNMNQSVTFLGFQFYKSQGMQLLLQARYYNTQGIPPLTDTVAPTLRGLQVIFEQKAKI
jgi:hypothetical protein